MGYRNSWRLAFQGGEVDVKNLINWMETRYPEETKERIVVDTIRSDETVEVKDHNMAVLYGEEWIKCDDPWDNVVTEILSKAEELNVGASYIRIGEESGDVDLRIGSRGPRVYSTTTITPVTFEHFGTIGADRGLEDVTPFISKEDLDIIFVRAIREGLEEQIKRIVMDASSRSDTLRSDVNAYLGKLLGGNK
jgi:hypothetical protein